jgi:hypothetical protein
MTLVHLQLQLQLRLVVYNDIKTQQVAYKYYLIVIKNMIAE